MIVQRIEIKHYRLVYCAPTTGGEDLVKDLASDGVAAVHTSWLGVDGPGSSLTGRNRDSKILHEDGDDCPCNECSAGRIIDHWLSTRSDSVVVTDIISDKVLSKISQRHLLHGKVPLSVVRSNASAYSAAAHAEGRPVTPTRASMWVRAGGRVAELSHLVVSVGFKSSDPVPDPDFGDMEWAIDALDFQYKWYVDAVRLDNVIHPLRSTTRANRVLRRRQRHMLWMGLNNEGNLWLMLKQGNGDGTGNEAMVYRGTVDEYAAGYPNWSEFSVSFVAPGGRPTARSYEMMATGVARFWWVDGEIVFVANLKGYNLAFESQRSVPLFALGSSEPKQVVVDPCFPVD